MKKSKKIASVLLSSTLIVSTAISAFAADYDLKSTQTGKKYEIQEWTFDDNLIIDSTLNGSNYTLEYGNKNYKVSDLMQAMRDGKNIEEAVKDLTPVDENVQGELKVESVSAINQNVFVSKADQVLKFTINGNTEPADLAALEEAGYTVTFNSNKNFLGTGQFTSTTGAVVNGDITDFEYQVVISKDGKEVASSEFATVKAISATTVESITAYKLNAGGVELEGNTITTSDTDISISGLKGTLVDGTKSDISSGATYESSNKSVAIVDATGKITVIQPGDVTITVKVGNAEKAIVLKVVDEARKLSTVTADKTSVGTVTGAKSSVVLTLKDQFGEVIKGQKVSIATVQNADKKDILTVTTDSSNIVSDEKGEITVALSADATNVGTGSLIVKQDTTTFLTIPVTVGSSENVSARKLELASSSKSKDNKIDVIDTDDNQIKLVYNKYAEGDLLIGPDDLTSFTVSSSDEDVITVSDADGVITVNPVATGSAKVVVKEGALVRAEYTVEVTNSTPSISSVTFEADPTIDVAGAYSFDKVLKASNIKLSDSAEVKINADGTIVTKANGIEVGTISFSSTVGSVTLEGTDALTVKIDGQDPVANGTGTIVAIVKDVNGDIVGTQPIDVKLQSQLDVAKAALSDAIDVATAMKNSATATPDEGITVGTYAQDDINTLETAIETAQKALDATDATVQSLKDAKVALDGAKTTFEQSVVEAVVTTVEVSVNPAEVTKPGLDETATSTATAVVKDQDGTEMTGQTVEFSLSSPVSGVSIDPETGVVTIDSSVENSSSAVTITVKATVGEKSGTANITVPQA